VVRANTHTRTTIPPNQHPTKNKKQKRSYDFQALRGYAPINALVTAWNICPVLEAAVAAPAAELAKRGAAARRAYLEEKAAFHGAAHALKLELYA
jgi:hypothetical protein